MPDLFLGIDIGSTKSHALVANAEGRALGLGMGGSGNPDIIGLDKMSELIRKITTRAVQQAGYGMGNLAGAGFGISGYDWPSQYGGMEQAIRKAGIKAPIAVVNDAMIGLVAGSSLGWGVGVTAGTGCNCWGRDQHGRIGRSFGYGLLFGEGAGASEMVAKAIQELVMQFTCRGPETRLADVFVQLAGAKDLADLLEGIVLKRYTIYPSAAPLIFQTAREGDLVARQLVLWAGRELGGMAVGVIRQLGIAEMPFEVVMSGSLFRSGSQLIEPLRETILETAPLARLVHLSAPPVTGGVILAMEQAGLDPRGLRMNLIKSAQELLEVAG
jgi:N-acetylglucosamine kinase-like BadF-type ATPase